MAKTVPLDEQIVATLTGMCTSEQADAVLADAVKVLADLTAQADNADVASLSPLATSAQARDLRQRASDHRFEADRMEASIAALQSRVADLKDAEADARRQADQDAVRKVRDALVTDIAKEYPEIVRQLTALVKRIVDNDYDCQRVGIESAEHLGRGLPATYTLRLEPVFRLVERPLPMPSDGRMSWQDAMDGMHYWGLGEDAK